RRGPGPRADPAPAHGTAGACLVLPNDRPQDPFSGAAPTSRGVTNAVSRAWPGARPAQVPADCSTAIAAVGNFDRIRSSSPGPAPAGPHPAAAPGAPSQQAQ